MGKLAIDTPEENRKLSGVLIKRNFNYHLLAPTDLHKYTDLVMSTINQKLSVYFNGTFDELKNALNEFECKEIEAKNGADKELIAFNCIHINLNTKDKYVTLEWISSSINDMYADSICAAIYGPDKRDG